MAAGGSTGPYPQDKNPLPWGAVLLYCLPGLMIGKTASVDGRPAHLGLTYGNQCIL